MLQDRNQQFAGNTSINAAICEMLDEFTELSRSRMRKKILQDGSALLKQQTDQADANARHTFREFLVAYQLNRNGFHLEYNKTVQGQTPDWLDERNSLLLEVFTCERGGSSDPKRRVAARIAEKVIKYDALLTLNALALVIAVHGDFESFFECDGCREAIRDSHIFDVHLNLGGVIYFAESTVVRLKQPDGSTISKQQYEFTYFPNPNSVRKIDLTQSLASRQ